MIVENTEKDEQSIFSKVLNSAYYFFVIIILTLGTISLLRLEKTIINSLLIGALVLSSVVLLFYIILKTFQHNIRVEKKFQLGLFIFTVGFLFILVALFKYFISATILSNFNYIYWGLGFLIGGFIIELTFIDQWIFSRIASSFRRIINAFENLIVWVMKYWQSIVLYGLDIISIGLIIFQTLVWQSYWWRYLLLALTCLWIPFHYRIWIWRAIKVIFHDWLYQGIVIGAFNLFNSIITSIITFFKYNWKQILIEIIRLLGVAVGGYLIYLGWSPVNYYFIGGGIAIILLSEIFSRKKILIWIYRTGKKFIIGIKNAIIRLFKGIKNLITNIKNAIKELLIAFGEFLQWIFTSLIHLGKIIYFFIRKNWLGILRELGRLSLLAIGIVLIVFSQNYYNSGVISLLLSQTLLGAGIALLPISEIFTRKRVWEIIIDNYIIVSRIIGFGIFLTGFIFILLKKYIVMSIVMMSIGGLFSLFAHYIYNPRMFVQHIKSALNFIKEHGILFVRLVGICLFITSMIFLVIQGWTIKTILLFVIGLVFTLFAHWIIKPSAFVAFLNKLWEGLISFVDFLSNNYIALFRMGGLILAILVRTVIFESWTALAIMLFILGILLVLFAHIILSPKRLVKFLKSLPERLKNFFSKLWKFVRFLSKYIYRNFLRLLLLASTIFSFVYGISVLVGKDFFNAFTDIVTPARISIGLGLLILSIASFYLLRHELKKLVKTKTKSLAEKVIRRIQDEL